MADNFFKLLSDSNQLKKSRKFLRDENPEAYKVLLDLLVIIETNLHYSEKHEYIKLANDFLTDRINADDFSFRLDSSTTISSI